MFANLHPFFYIYNNFVNIDLNILNINKTNDTKKSLILYFERNNNDFLERKCIGKTRRLGIAN